jgi:hypothetical protein
LSAYQPSVVIVSEFTDTLASAVAVKLQSEGIYVVQTAPYDLGDLRVTLHEDEFIVNDSPVSGILFRSLPNSTLSQGFPIEDRGFCDSELRAVWLAALHLPRILAINRYDAEAWFEAVGWPVWRRKLVEQEIHVSPFVFGGVVQENLRFWHPYTSLLARPVPDNGTVQMLGSALTQSVRQQESLVVCGEVISGEILPVVVDTMNVLEKAGVWIASIATDSDATICSVNTLPTIPESHTLAHAVNLIRDRYYAHLSRW